MKASRLFCNPWPHAVHGIADIWRWKAGWLPREEARVAGAPDEPAAVVALDPWSIATPPDSGWRVTWLGHASFLLQGVGVSVLVDPIFSTHCGPLPLPSLRRLCDPPCLLEDLPEIEAVLLTHTHYDHLDLPTLRKLRGRVLLVVPEGHAGWLRRAGFAEVVEVAWYDRYQLADGLTIYSMPAQHFTARTPWDRDRGHWCGWLLDGAGCSLWHAGDSGYCAGFAEMGERCGPIDFAMLPIGAYQPRSIMQPMHMDPHEAVRAFLDARCRRAVGMHWGTFRLTDEPLGEPPWLLAEALAAQGVAEADFMTGVVGQSWWVTPHGVVNDGQLS